MNKPNRTKEKNRRTAVRSRAGFSMAEVACSAFVVIFMLILAIDVWMLISAVQMNDSACRDAARAAAQAPDQSTANYAATAAVSTHKSLASMFNVNPTIDQCVYVDYAAPATIPPSETPYVTVTTSCQVHPIIPLSVFGTLIIGNGIVRFYQTYTFPIVKSKALPSPP